MFLYLQSFENGEYQADLSDTPPHVIAAVLKLYLRQVSKLKSVPPPILWHSANPLALSNARSLPLRFCVRWIFSLLTRFSEKLRFSYFQLPESLLTVKLYPEFIRVAKVRFIRLALPSLKILFFNPRWSCFYPYRRASRS